MVTRLRSNADATDPLAYLAARIAGAALTATTVILIAGSLSKSAYGTFAVVIAVAGALVVVADLGLTSSLARYVARGTVDRALLIRVIVLRAALATGAGALLALYGAGVEAGWTGGSYASEVPTLLYLGGALVLANSFTALVSGLLPVFRSIRALMLLTVLRPVLELVGVATVLALSLEASGVMAAMVVAAALTAAVAVPTVVRRAPTAEDVSSLTSVARYGSALAVVWVSMALFGVVDLLAIGYFHDSETVAPYALALKLIGVIQLPGLAIATIVAPRLASGGSRPLHLFESWLGTLLAAYAGLVVIAAVLAPQVFAAIGSEYDGDSPLLLALAPYALLAGIAPLVSMAANYLGGARRRLRLAIGTLVLNIVLDVMLVPSLGAYGAVLATTVAFAWYVGGHLRLTYELLEGRPRLHAVVPRLPGLIAALVLSAAVAWLAAAPLDDRPWIALAIAGPAALAAYALAAGASTRGLAKERTL
jgi:O-antigen/teichoic acid export membrane protein